MWQSPPPVPLTSLPLIQAEQGWGSLQRDLSVQRKAMLIGGVAFKGLGTHAKSDLLYALGGKYRRFSATVGIDDEMKDYPDSSISFTVIGDGRVLWQSGLMKHDAAAKSFDVDVDGVQALELKVGDGGDGINGDHADWGDPVLTPWSPRFPMTSKRVIQAGKSVSMLVNSTGKLTGVRLGKGGWLPVEAETWILGSTPVGEPKLLSEGSGVTIEKEVKVGKTTCVVSDRLTPEKGAIRWDIEVRSSGPMTTAPIVTNLHWGGQTPRIWAAWNDPIGPETGTWHDPLEPQAMTERSWSYGEPLAGDWISGDIVSLPEFSLFPTHGDGLTFMESPTDSLPEARLSTAEDGTVIFSRNHIRLGHGQVVHLTGYLVPHRAGVRGALKEIVSRFPDYFNPSRRSVESLGGCAAYSGDERVLSPDQVKQLNGMDFSTMWKLSDDYVYMGMFLPPTKDPREPWTRTPDDGSPAGYKPLETSASKLNGYGRMLQSHGFHLLNYFNACEYGVDMKEVAASASPDSQNWKDASHYLADTFPNAPLRDGAGKPVGAWQGGWVVDPGDPAYREYLLGQAQLYLDRVPDSDGVCIDRADYLKLHNSHADDGISWYDGPARSYVFSWQKLTEALAARMGPRGKVIFSNLMDPRLDLTRHLDGLYCEFGNLPTVLNGVSFLCLNKPLLAWTSDNDKLSDEFFQRELYLGAFPTAPYPTNNHCILPSPEHDRWFAEYGPLFAALKGRKWVLDGVSASADGAKVNLFKVGSGYVAVVAFAGSADQVRLAVTGAPRSAGGLTALSPGGTSVVLKAAAVQGGFEVDVPINRGCAVVRF